jgi:glycopeptide antibiotics resistance protein
MAASKRHKGCLFVLFLIYLALLCYFLFFSEGFGRTDTGEYRYNLHLFQEIMRFTHHRQAVGFWSYFINIYGNVLAFVPLGFFLPALCGMRKRGVLVVLSCFTLSLMVETIQLVCRLGSFDVDDLFLNTCGGLLGYLIYMLCYRMARIKKKRKGKHYGKQKTTQII